MRLNDDQEKAVEQSTRLPLSIVNGGAGVGKTTTIKAIAKKLTDNGENVVLCCPTGKAAARLREATGMNTSTIHRMLEYNGVGFQRKDLNRVTVIVDESSMCDSNLMAEICKRTPKRLILVGDQAQLMPVDSGAPFHDLVNLKPEIVTTLNICYRNSEAVYQASLAVRKGEQPPPILKSEKELYQIDCIRDMTELKDHVNSLLGTIDFQQDIILCPKNGTKTKVDNEEFDVDSDFGTVKTVNEMVINKLDNRDDKTKWVVGDRVICLKNFSNLDVWNGTTGTVMGVTSSGRQKGSLVVEGDIPFWDELTQQFVDTIEWPNEVVSECQHAFALTIHKSQGSQYRKVYFISRARDQYMFSRPLIYTALTRAKNECHVVGDPYAYNRGITKTVEKQTVIQKLHKGFKIASFDKEE